MKIKNDYDITLLIHNSIFTDIEGEQGSKYRLFVKDMSFQRTVNKLSLIIIDYENGYVVNNDLNFTSLEVNDNQYIFKSVNPIKSNKVLNLTFYKL